MVLASLRHRAKEVLHELRETDGRSFDTSGAMAILEDLEELSDEEVAETGQLQLAALVFNVVLEKTESFEASNIGADLAYLLGAIIKNNIVEWERQRLPPLYFILSSYFGKEHPVWTHIAIWEEPAPTKEK